MKLNCFEIDGGLGHMSGGANPAKWEVTLLALTTALCYPILAAPVVRVARELPRA